MTLLARVQCARFEGRFSELSKSVHIQGMRKVENTKRIFVHPIHMGAQNCWPGWGFGTRKSSIFGCVTPWLFGWRPKTDTVFDPPGSLAGAQTLDQKMHVFWTTLALWLAPKHGPEMTDFLGVKIGQFLTFLAEPRPLAGGLRHFR